MDTDYLSWRESLLMFFGILFIAGVLSLWACTGSPMPKEHIKAEVEVVNVR